ncbi:MAG: helix-turn-helix domain-containing protein [Actinobacteria bacterium]|nr:helix-turn-helix domain-containing protein [Actinomycetota bacterium]
MSREQSSRNSTTERLITVEELSELLRVPVRTIYRWQQVRTGPKAIRVGRDLRFRPTAVTEWLVEQESFQASQF